MNNLFIIVGRITKDIELRYTRDNKAVCDITLASNISKDETSFVKVSLWGKVAETTAKYCKKGDLVGTSGIIKNNDYQDKDGNKRYEYNFIANKISFLSSKKNVDEIKQNEENVNQKNEDEEDPFSAFGEKIEIEDNFLE